MMESLEVLRENYFNTILTASMDIDLTALLPSPLQDNFYSLMNGIMELLKGELNDYQDLLYDISDIDLRREYLQEMANISNKLMFIRNYMTSIKDNVDDNILEFNNNKGFVFGRNPSGNISFLGDLKRNIPIEYYPAVLDLLNGLSDSVVLNNPLKVKKLSNNEKLNGLMEIKSFKVRIIFKKLPNNLLYIMMLRMKKDNNSLKDVDEPYRRGSLLSKDYTKVKNRIKNDKDVAGLINLGNEDLEVIKNYISTNIGSVKYGA